MPASNKGFDQTPRDGEDEADDGCEAGSADIGGESNGVSASGFAVTCRGWLADEEVDGVASD